MNSADANCAEDGQQKADKDLEASSDKDSEASHFLTCEEKTPLLTEKSDEISCYIHVSNGSFNSHAHDSIVLGDQAITLLPKMLTEPSDLHGLLSKNPPRQSRTFFDDLSSPFKINATVCPSGNCAMVHSGVKEISRVKDDIKLSPSVNGPCKSSSLYAMQKTLKYGKADFPCLGCQRHESLHGIVLLKPLPSSKTPDASCNCRFSYSQNHWPVHYCSTPKALKDDIGERKISLKDFKEYGSMCQWCGQTFGEQQSTRGGHCSWSRANSGLLHPCHTTPLISMGVPSPHSSLVLAPSDSCHSCLVMSREQGVQVSNWSISSVSTCSGPLCRICHSPGDKVEPLMSPCRCSGTLKFVHLSCLLRWLEISRRKLHRAPHCELCGYKYRKHKIVRLRKLQWPNCSRRDRMLHITFLAAILIMVLCAATTIFCFKAERQQKSLTSSDKIELTSQEVVTLICGVTFFCAFFLAMYVEVKAQTTVYKLIVRFWTMNQEWRIEEYRPERDPQLLAASKKCRIRPAPSSSTEPHSSSV